MRKLFSFLPLAAALGLAVLPMWAAAQTASQEGLHGVVGLGVLSGPAYAGSKETRNLVVPLPLLSYRKGAFEASSLGGLRYWALDNADWKVSLGLSVDGGRDEKQSDFGSGSDRLAGMGKIRASAELGFSATWLGGPAPVTLDVRTSPGHRGHGGTHGSLSTELPILAKDRLRLAAFAGLGFGDANYNQAYFGVSEAQAVTSQFSAFKAGAGFNSLNLGLSANYQIADRWVAIGRVGYQRALGDATNSPLTERKGAPVAMVGVGYTF